MKITFLEEHCSVLSGNSFYEVGVKADLRRGQELIDAGIAYAGWGKHPTNLQGESNDLQDLPLDDLRNMAKERGIRGYWNMKEETLIERLGE